MTLRMGQAIPAHEIAKRYKDEDGETFLELWDNDNVLYRVTEGDRFYYKIEKDKLEDEELTLVADYSKDEFRDEFRSESGLSIHDVPTTVQKAVKPEDFANFVPSWEDSSEQTETKTARARNPLDAFDSNPQVGNGEIKELREGEVVPEKLRHLCKGNDYGGYSLRYNKFLYILDGNFRVDVKTPDTSYNYQLEAHPQEDLEPSRTEIGQPGSTGTGTGQQEFQKGDFLPPHLRDRCEQELGPGGGSRITIGNFLYSLDTHYRITQKMRIQVMDNRDNDEPLKKRQKISAVDFGGLDPDWEARAKKEKAAEEVKKAETAAIPELTDKQIINNVVRVFLKGLKQFNITANFFVEKTLAPKNGMTLYRAYHGDLSGLNDDTLSATAQGKLTRLEEKGLRLLKAALIHELYIKSTLSGRGNNMKFFLTYLAAAQPDGTVGKFYGYMSRQEQMELMEYFKSRAELYSDKSDVLKRVYRHLRANAPDEYMELKYDEKEVTFNAYVIMKLYQQTNRMDRGDGITMMRMCRDLLMYGDLKKK